MTEQEWLVSTDPAAMLRLITENPDHVNIDCIRSDRQLRLFACACARQVWPLLTDPRSRRAVEVAERYANGEATEGELDCALREVWHLPYSLPRAACLDEAATAARAALSICGSEPLWGTALSCPPLQAHLLRCVVGNPWRPVNRASWYATGTYLAYYDGDQWNDLSAALALALAADAGDASALGPLADALEEAECPAEEKCPKCRGGRIMFTSDEDIDCLHCNGTDRVPSPLLAHLRQPAEVPCPACRNVGEFGTCDACRGAGRLAQPHALPGCWAVSLLLGKE